MRMYLYIDIEETPANRLKLGETLRRLDYYDVKWVETIEEANILLMIGKKTTESARAAVEYAKLLGIKVAYSFSQFVKTPKPGQVIKTYAPVAFGEVLRTELRLKSLASGVYRLMEVVFLEQIKEVEFQDIDFFLDSDKYRYVIERRARNSYKRPSNR